MQKKLLDAKDKLDAAKKKEQKAKLEANNNSKNTAALKEKIAQLETANKQLKEDRKAAAAVVQTPPECSTASRQQPRWLAGGEDIQVQIYS